MNALLGNTLVYDITNDQSHIFLVVALGFDELFKSLRR